MIPEVSCEFMQAIMSPYYLWQSGSSGTVWRQTSQTGGVFLMNKNQHATLEVTCMRVHATLHAKKLMPAVLVALTGSFQTTQ